MLHFKVNFSHPHPYFLSWLTGILENSAVDIIFKLYKRSKSVLAQAFIITHQ